MSMIHDLLRYGKFVGGGSGGVTSWNDLTDKPFYEEVITCNPYFDNDLTGREVLPIRAGVNLVKITDYVLSEEECVGAVMTIVSQGHEDSVTISSNGVIDVTDEFGIPSFMATPDLFIDSGLPCVGVVKKSGLVQGFEVSAGTYYLSEESTPLYISHFSALDNPKTIIHKLDSKFVDAEWMATTTLSKGDVVLEETALDFQSNADGTQASNHAGTLSLEKNKTYCVTWDGIEYKCVCGVFYAGDVEVLYLGNVALSGSDTGLAETGEPFAVICIPSDEPFWNVGCKDDGNDHTVGICELDEVVNKLPEKFLPSTPLIDLIELGMEAVSVGGEASTANGVEELKALMKNGPFRYKGLLNAPTGQTIEVVACANPFYSETAGLYSAVSMCFFAGTMLAVELSIPLSSNEIKIKVTALS